MSRYLLLGLVLALLSMGFLSACTAQGGISILPPESGGESGGTAAVYPTLLAMVVILAIVAIAVAALRL
jgi:hypothetical protein